jgi:hypothetical protein
VEEDMDINKIKEELNSIHNNLNKTENSKEISMDEYMKILEKGIEYANTFPEEDRFCLSPNFRSFQKKMMVWFDEHIPEDFLKKLVDKYPRRRDEILKRLMALTAEGKSLENSLLK